MLDNRPSAQQTPDESGSLKRVIAQNRGIQPGLDMTHCGGLESGRRHDSRHLVTVEEHLCCVVFAAHQ